MKHFAFKVNRVVPCNGTSIWMDSHEIKPKVTEIKIEVHYVRRWVTPYILVWAKHNGPWEIYTDSGFEKGVSEIVSKKIGKKVRIAFTEQGMQETGRASMEPASKTADATMIKFFKEKVK